MTSVLGAVAFMSLAISAFAYFCPFRKLRQRPSAAQALPHITVLKPLRGLDEGLRDNLLAICHSDYPAFDMLLCAADPHDPALAVAREVEALCPGRRIRVLVGDVGTGHNPKIRLLRCMLAHAESDWLVVSDSNVRPEPDYLRALMATQQETGAALVHSLLQGAAGSGLGARLQNLQMNAWMASSVAFADAGHHAAVVGKSMLLGRRALAEVGGFEGVQDVLAEDYVLGARFAAHGHGVALSPHLVPVVGGDLDLSGFLERQLRWAQLRRRVTAPLFLGELLVHPLPFFLALAWVGGAEHGLLALFGMVVKWSLDAAAYIRLDRNAHYWTLLLLPLKDLMAPFIWLVAAFRTRVSWRGHHLRLGAGTKLVPLGGRPFDVLWDRV